MGTSLSCRTDGRVLGKWLKNQRKAAAGSKSTVNLYEFFQHIGCPSPVILLARRILKACRFSFLRSKSPQGGFVFAPTWLSRSQRSSLEGTPLSILASQGLAPPKIRASIKSSFRRPS